MNLGNSATYRLIGAPHIYQVGRDVSIPEEPIVCLCLVNHLCAQIDETDPLFAIAEDLNQRVIDVEMLL